MNLSQQPRNARTAAAGFTLLEIMIVVVIIGVLATLLIVNYGPQRDKGFEITARTQVKGNLAMTLELYFNDHSMYPTTEQGLQALFTKPTTEPIPANWKQLLTELPVDPWGHAYQYRYPGVHNQSKFDVFSMGPDGQPDTADDIGNWPKPSTQ